MNPWSFQTRSSLIHSEDPYSQPYRAVVRTKNNYLAHHGVKGMHWGEITKQYQPVAVDHRRIRTSQSQENVKSANSQQNSETDNSVVDADKKKNVRTILAIAGGITLAAITGYALHRHLGNVVNRKQKEIMDILDNMKMPTTSSGWTAEQKMQWKSILNRHANERVSEITRGSVVRDKLHLTKRADILKERRRSFEVGDFYRKANEQAEIKRQIERAHKELKQLQDSIDRPGLNEGIKNMYKRNVLDQTRRIEELLEKQKRMIG